MMDRYALRSSVSSTQLLTALLIASTIIDYTDAQDTTTEPYLTTPYYYDVDPCYIYSNFGSPCNSPSYLLYPYPFSCQHYYYCRNGGWYGAYCGSGLYFSQNQRQCTLYDGSCFPGCPDLTLSPPDVTVTDKQQPISREPMVTEDVTVTDKQQPISREPMVTEEIPKPTLSYDIDPCTIIDGQYCNSPPYQYFPAYWACNWYYFCNTNGRWSSTSCSTNYWFSTVQHQCVLYGDGNCHPGCHGTESPEPPGDTTTAPAPAETTTDSPDSPLPEETTATTSFTTAYWPTDPTVPGQCRATPCIHGSLCFDDSNQYKCECETGYTGQFCQLDKCLSGSPCVHGTICLKEMGSYKCDCFPGYTGFYCENRIDYCASRPCDNGATCLDTGNGYVCQCLAGYTGLRCETDINECASENCRNGGSCEDLIGGFLCHCPAGFTGRYCEYNINECASNPCVNDSACIDGVNGYRCQCLAGFTGVHCETDIDECESNPCYNEGKCEDLINEFKCECSVWYTGNRCEYERCPDPLLVQQHMDGPFFYKTWQEMQYQAGSQSSDFWIGLINFNSKIQEGHSGGLMVILTESVTNQVYFARYENFYVGTSGDNFRMTVSGFSGNAGDALGFHSGAQFSTRDRDNDLSSNNLAETCGAFWYNSNSRANIAADNAKISFVWYPEDRYIKLDKVSMYLCRPAQYTVSV